MRELDGFNADGALDRAGVFLLGSDVRQGLADDGGDLVEPLVIASVCLRQKDEGGEAYGSLVPS